MRIGLVVCATAFLSACGVIQESKGDIAARVYLERERAGAGVREKCDLANNTTDQYRSEGNTEKYQEFYQLSQSLCGDARRLDEIEEEIKEASKQVEKSIQDLY
jgi:hypothetical protein